MKFFNHVETDRPAQQPCQHFYCVPQFMFGVDRDTVTDQLFDNRPPYVERL